MIKQLTYYWCKWYFLSPNSLFFLLLILLLDVSALSAQEHATGEVFDTELYNSLPLKARVSTRSLLPPRVSLEQYCPTPGNQGEYMTCAAWSSAYHFRTIIEAKQRGITDRKEIDKLVYSPTWVYEILKEETDNSCLGGLATARTLVVFREIGVPTYASLPFTCLSGSQEERFAELDALMEEAAAARIRDLQILFLAKEGVDPSEKIQAIKKVLAEGFPVLVSHTLYDSFHSSTEVWHPKEGEELARNHGSHAMVIVGYDDEKYGGAFRYLNSWGASWGDDGFLWVPYAVTGDLCYGAYQAFPYPVTSPVTVSPTTPPPPSISVPSPSPPPPAPMPIAEASPSGRMDFRLNDGSTMPISRISTRNLIVEDESVGGPEMTAYRMVNAYASGTRFRFYLETENEGYIYAFATDLTQKVNLIFPYNDQVSPLVGRNSIIAFPSDTKVIRMDSQPGTDYLLVLYSQQALDVDQLMDKMASTSGGLTAKVQAALGTALIDPKMVQYEAGQVGFRVPKGTAGTVVPIMVEISHR